MVTLTMLVLVTGAAPTSVSAQVSDVRTAMHRYYDGEFQGGFGWSSTGGVSLAAGVPMLVNGQPLTVGLGVPTVSLGAAQLGLGIASFFTAPARIKRFDAQLDTSPAEFLATERPRIEGLTRAFRVFQAVELALIVAGSGVAGAGFARREDTWVGVGLGVVFQSLMFLVLDEVAKRRADDYLSVLSVAHDGLAR